MLSLKEKISYGLGDFGCNVVFATVSSWFVPFCVSVGVSVEQAGLILFLSKLVDAICDVCLGIAIDNDQTRIKKLMKVGAATMAVPLLLLFSAGLFPQSARFALLFLLFTLTNSVLYNFFNIPYASLNLAMTSDSKERYSLNVFRMVGSVSCMTIINIIYPMVDNKLLLYFVCSVVMVLCFIATIKSTKMRVAIKKNPIDFRYLKSIFFEPSFWLAAAVFFTINFKLNVTMCNIGLNAETVSPGAATMLFMVPSIAIMLFLPKLLDTEQKKYTALAVALILDFAAQTLIKESLLRYAFFGFITFPVMSSMIYNLFAKVNDDIYRKTSERLSGLIFATAGIISNLCAGLVGLFLNRHISLDSALAAVTVAGAVCAVAILSSLLYQKKTA